MKKTLITYTILIVVGIQASFAQDVEKQVSGIRREVAEITRNANKYTKTTREIDGISLEGTVATYFTSGKRLKKITAKSYGETYNSTTELFYQGDQLIFVFQKFNRYDTQIGSDKPVKVVMVKESRFYFENGRMIRFLNGKVSVKRTAKSWSDSESEIKSLSSALKDAF